MPVFRFKHFSVSNERSAMKVNTDGVLLGALMTVAPSDRYLLDIGTGTGSVALMVAQRLAPVVGSAAQDVRIFAVDIDGPSADEAAENFSGSPWAGMLEAKNMSLAEYDSSLPDGTVFDAVFSNPPYFESSLKAPDARRRAARHADTLSYRDIISFAAQRLTERGILSMILPSDAETSARRYAASWSLPLFRIVRVRTTPRHPVSRTVMEFSRPGTNAISGYPSSSVPAQPVVEMLTIRNEGGYSEEYRSLTSEFLFI